MRVPFRQGIIRHQTDITNNPTFLQLTAAGVSLIVSPDPTLLTFAHGSSADYLFEERKTVVNAWPGPFTTGVDYWLYWDLDLITGNRTFGRTTVEPVDGSSQPQGNIPNDKHWFDTTESVMKVRSGNRWIEKIRVFAGKIDEGAVLVPYTTGTQVGFNSSVRAGFLIFDDEDNAVKKFDRFGRGKFITTESPLASQVSKLASFRLEAELVDAEAVEYIPQLYCITYKGPRKVGLASYTLPGFPAIGVATEEMFVGEVRSFISSGYLSSENWNWTQPPGTKIFVGVTGELTTTVPQKFSIQQVAVIVNNKTILVDVQPLIVLDES